MSTCAIFSNLVCVVEISCHTSHVSTVSVSAGKQRGGGDLLWGRDRFDILKSYWYSTLHSYSELKWVPDNL